MPKSCQSQADGMTSFSDILQYIDITVKQIACSKFVCSHKEFLFVFDLTCQGVAEPMQVDGQQEENDNVEEDHYVVENTSMVGTFVKHY